MCSNIFLSNRHEAYGMYKSDMRSGWTSGHMNNHIVGHRKGVEDGQKVLIQNSLYKLAY